jgi:hypothetical protein
MANFNITIPGARVSPLIQYESGIIGNAVRYLIYGSDIKVAAATGITDTITVLLGKTPKNFAIVGAFAYISQAFAGPGGLTAQIGTLATPAAVLDVGSVLATGFKQPANGIYSLAISGTAPVEFYAVFTSAVSGGPAATTAGIIEIVLQILDLDQLY